MKEKVYCNYCGKENEKSKKLCKKCLRPLNPSDHLLKEYFEKKGFGELEDGFYAFLKKWIRTHLYGIVMTCSIILSAVTIMVPTFSKAQYEIVSEKPVVTSYAGAGLSKEEVVLKYMEAVKTNNQTVMKNLRLETFYPDIKKEIGSRKYDFSEAYFSPLLNYDYSNNSTFYYKDLKKQYELNEASPVYGVGKGYHINQYGNYTSYTYEAVFSYCFYNDCEKELDDPMANPPMVLIWVQVIEVDGNYYVIGDRPEYQTTYDFVVGKLLLEYQGDTSTLSAIKVNEILNNPSTLDEYLKELE